MSQSPIFSASAFAPAHRLMMLGVLCGSLALVGCSANETASRQAPSSSEKASSDVQGDFAQNAAPIASEVRPLEPRDVSRSTPQLIKTADLTLRVKAVDKALEQVSSITQAQQGDLLNLQDQRPLEKSDRHIAAMTLRVPQAQLESTLSQLRDLGQVQSQAIQAQDVSNQIVDSTARLRNLRKSETLVLEIMERSGSIKDVLTVSQRLSEIREQIEKIDAQLQSLKTQVAFSTIRLRLEAATVSLPPKEGLGARLGETWSTSTHAMGEFLTVIMSFGIWALVFSPVLIFLGLGAMTLQRKLAHSSANPVSDDQNRRVEPSSPALSPPPLSGETLSGETLGGETSRRQPEKTIDNEGA